MNPLKDFFEEERKRVFQPDAFFAKRVVARLNSRALPDYGIWDVIPGSARPVLAVALTLILCFVLVELFVPQMPQTGMIEAYLSTEQSPAESFLYSEADVPSHQEVLEQVIALEEQK